MLAGSQARCWLALAVVLSIAGTAPAQGEPSRAAEAQSVPWCAPEIESLAGDVCYHRPPSSEGPRTLVIFLHGLVQAGTDWQHAQQRGFVRAAERHGFSVIMPRGRQGAMSRAPDMIAWPTSHTAQAQHEAALLAEWKAAQRAIEAREGAAFERVFVMGFSNGAYYATSLALRGQLEVDGYAVFAGGSGARYLERAGRAAKRRAPIFVAIAGKDSTAKNGRELARLLRRLGWPHRAETRGVGHAVADAHLEHAYRYLTSQERADR